MSTLPHNPPAANLETPGAVVRAHEWDLDVAIRDFEATADALGAPRPASDELAKMTHEVAAITRELFAGELIVETDVDSEIHDDVCLLFQVEAAGTVDEIVALNNAWVRRTISVTPQWPGLLCLMIDAR